MENKKLFLGVAQMDITPPVGYWMAGFAARNKPSRMVHDPLCLKVMTLFDGKKRVAIVNADLISFSNKFCKMVKDEIKRETGFSESDVFLFASHTHTGPLINENSSYLPDKKYFPEDYRTLLIKKICGGIKEALLREEEVNVFHGEGEASIGINRRMKTSKGIKMKPNPEGPVDNIVQVLKFQRADGSLAALIFKACCHPTTLKEIYEISADYPGAARREIEKIYPGVSAMFINGCCGDVRPPVVRNGDFIAGSFSDVERIGKALAREVIKCTEKSEPLKGVSVKSRQIKHCLEFDEGLIPKNLKHLVELTQKYIKEEPELTKEIEKWAEKIGIRIDKKEKLPKGVNINIMTLEVGNFSLAALPGEVMVEYGLKIRRLTKGKVMVAAYANEDIGYVPTQQAIKDGGYEAKSFIWEGDTAPYDYGIEAKLISSVLAILEKQKEK